MTPQDKGGIFYHLVAHPVAVFMVSTAAIVFGYVSLQRLPIELMPDISYPTITVRTAFEGAAPQEVESQVSRPLEESLATLDGLVRLESRSRAGNSDVLLGFQWGTDMAGVSQTIRENVQITRLPEEADRPLILRFDPSLEPFLRVALSVSEEAIEDGGDYPLFELRQAAEGAFKRELEAMDGVAAVRIRGGLEREIHIEIHEEWLAARKLTLGAIQRTLASENINISGGSIEEGHTEYLIRTLNEYTGPEDLEDLLLRRDDGVLVPLTDVAVIHPTHKEREVISRLNGVEAVEVELYKESDANIVEVANRVKEALGDGGDSGDKSHLSKQLPEGVVLEVLDDQGAYIEAAVSNLMKTAVLGGLLAILILYLFLRDLRATAIISASIPISIVVAFAPLHLWGISLNLMSLGGLALGIGMLVDNGVVVLENISRHREQGLSSLNAAVEGVSDIAAAVVASTLTTVAVFLPMGFVEGIGGQLFGDLAIAVVASLIASLVVALCIVPTLAALDMMPLIGGLSVPSLPFWDQHSEHKPSSPRRLSRLKAAFFNGWKASTQSPIADWRRSREWVSEKRFRKLVFPYFLLRFLGHWLTLMCVVAFLGVSAAVSRQGLRMTRPLIRKLGNLSYGVAGGFQHLYGRVDARYSEVLEYSLSRPLRIMGWAALLFLVALWGAKHLGSELIPELHQGRFFVDMALEVGTPLEETSQATMGAEKRIEAHEEVEVVYSTVGAERRLDSRSDEGEHTSRVRVRLTPDRDLEAQENRVMEDLRGVLASMPRIKAKMARPTLFSHQNPIEVIIYGWELDSLSGATDQVVSVMRGVEGLRDVRASLSRGFPEVQIRYDRERLHRLGLGPAAVAETVRDKIKGVEATEIHQKERRIPLIVRLEKKQRNTLESLKNININPAVIPPIPLISVAEIVEAYGPSEIRRLDQQRAVVVTANVAGFDLGSVTEAIQEAVLTLPLPEGIRVSVAGQSEEMRSSIRSLALALLLAVFLVFVVMASTFESLIHPLVILFSVPLAFVGAVCGLAIVSSPISVVVFLGLIVTAGVVVNNAIVLVDTINRLRGGGMALVEAVRHGAKLRLRPILMTTATTVLGLFPLSLGLGAGSEIQQPLAATVMGGLLSSTLLTLVVIPVVYISVSTLGSPKNGEPEPLGQVDLS